ncbi:hypothetical protein D3Z36_14645 [Lachnospiraceae bacterium]|nr:hypothetical protein [Lachnospiraceae bacterium]
MYSTNPALQQKMMQLDQQYAQEKTNIMQSFYNQQGNGWGQQPSPAPAQPSAPAANVNWIYVSGIEEAKKHIVQPGNTAWLMDNNEPYFYVKTVDGVGSVTFRIFQFSEVAETTPEPQAQIDLSQYVQRDEFDELKAQLEQLTTNNKKPPVKANKGAEDNG